MSSNHDFEVTLVNGFEASSMEDAVGQMATWVSDNAYHAGYRVSNLNTGESRFIDADNINWEIVSEEG